MDRNSLKQCLDGPELFPLYLAIVLDRGTGRVMGGCLVRVKSFRDRRFAAHALVLVYALHLHNHSAPVPNACSNSTRALISTIHIYDNIVIISASA